VIHWETKTTILHVHGNDFAVGLDSNPFGTGFVENRFGDKRVVQGPVCIQASQAVPITASNEVEIPNKQQPPISLADHL
jgi:hypothetical protein